VASAAANSTLIQVAFDVARPSESLSGDVLLTVVFDDGSGGFLRVIRQDGDAAETIAENLYEGTGLPDQRTLLLRNVGAQGATKIVFQASGAAQPLRRLVWEWPRPQAVAILGEAPALVRERSTLTAGEVSGQPLPAPRPMIDIDYTSMPLLNQPARVQGDASFAVALGNPPAHARLAAKILGLPLDRQLDCWVNGRRIGTLAAILPTLQDPAYLLPTGQDAALASWRRASLYLPASAWQPGENRIEFHPTDNGGGNAPVYALKDVVLEFVYQDTPSVGAATPLP
jgi:hypothetical protein